MSHGKHLNEDQRGMILNLLCKKSKLVEIADLLEMDPSSISKELQRNRVLTKNGLRTKAVSKHCVFPMSVTPVRRSMPPVHSRSISTIRMPRRRMPISVWYPQDKV